MAHFLPPELVRQVNKLEWPNVSKKTPQYFTYLELFLGGTPTGNNFFRPNPFVWIWSRVLVRISKMSVQNNIFKISARPDLDTNYFIPYTNYIW